MKFGYKSSNPPKNKQKLASTYKADLLITLSGPAWGVKEITRDSNQAQEPYLFPNYVQVIHSKAKL